MAKDSLLNKLGQERDLAFQSQQNAYNEMESVGDKRTRLKKSLDNSWQSRCDAQRIMNHEFDSIQRERDRINSLWETYKQEGEIISNKIDEAKREQEYYHQEMSRCFDMASEAYNYGNKADAPYYSQQGHNARAKRDDWTNVVRSLISESKSLHRPDSISDYNFKSYKQGFEKAKAEHERIQNDYSKVKQEHEEKREIFNQKKVEFQNSKREFVKRLDFLKNETERKRKAGERVFEIAKGKYAYTLKEDIAKQQRGVMQTQYQDNEFTVKVRSGWSKDFSKPTTDIVVYNNDPNFKFHRHIVFDEDGNELINRIRRDH